MSQPCFIGIAAANWKLTATAAIPAKLWRVLPEGDELVGEWSTAFGDISITPKTADYKPGLYIAEERHPNPNLAARGETFKRGYVIMGPYSIWTLNDECLPICQTIIDGSIT